VKKKEEQGGSGVLRENGITLPVKWRETNTKNFWPVRGREAVGKAGLEPD